jgi:hypothetical protein
MQRHRVRADGDVEKEGCVEWGLPAQGSRPLNTYTCYSKDPISIASSHRPDELDSMRCRAGEHRRHLTGLVLSRALEKWRGGENRPWGDCTSRHSNHNAKDSCGSLNAVYDGLSGRPLGPTVCSML